MPREGAGVLRADRSRRAHLRIAGARKAKTLFTSREGGARIFGGTVPRCPPRVGARR